MNRIVSVSAAPYDGWDPPALLDSLARCGATHVEPAFIVGYTEPFDEDAFSDANTRRYAGWLRESGLRCHAMSSHIDLGGPDAVAVFRGRMDFARRLGAFVINTNAAVRANETAFLRNVEPILRHAEQLGLVIGLENPGDGRPNLIDVAADGIALLRRIGSPRLRLNYDAANTASHRPGVDAIADAVAALPFCAHLHLKAVRRTANGWFNVPLGEGDDDGDPLLAALAAWPDLPLGIELPLRMHRGPDAQPWRRVARLEVPAIEDAVRRSLVLLRSCLAPPTDGARQQHAAP